MTQPLRTKIVATIGPASQDHQVLEAMIRAGMNVARLNFSHGDHAFHARSIELVRAAAAQVGKPVALLADLQGPKLRVGTIEGEGVRLEAGQLVTLSTEEDVGHNGVIPVQCEGLPAAVEPGDRILLDDGLIELEVVNTAEHAVEARVIVGGVLRSKKGLNLPRTSLNISAITNKDRHDLQFALLHHVDWVALSFVRTAQEILELKELIRQASAFGHLVPVIAKIEKPEALSNLDAIIQAADGIMVARGDLAIETSSEEVPLIQKEIIRACNVAGKPVITATQMLESMVHNPRPTRAEASDVANAIFDGTDAVMLSAETASGAYPVESVRMMARIAARAEEALVEHLPKPIRASEYHHSVAEAVAHAAVMTAMELKARAIITPTMSGSTARLVSKFRPPQLIVATTPNVAVQRRLVLHWGVHPFLAPRTENTDKMIETSVDVARREGFAAEGDIVVLAAGMAGSPPGSTDLMKVHSIRRVLGRGTGIGDHVVTGRVRKLIPPVDPSLEIGPDEIIVAPKTDHSFIDVAQRAAGLIVERGGTDSHAALLAVELGVPTVVGVKGATHRLEDGQKITLDARQGVIYEGA
ncbi:MAG: pyruvate kinase [Ardenticatenia bacterium]|nr:pyruvate kinase [Ardenticatenia bacterium]